MRATRCLSWPTVLPGPLNPPGRGAEDGGGFALFPPIASVPLPNFLFFLMPRPVYTLLAQVKAKLPYEFIVEALDDDRDGMIDDEVWQAVCEDAATQVDSRMGKRYPVPFDPAELPPIIESSALMFVLETLYQRRGYGTEENNPFLSAARAARKELTEIGNGEQPFMPAAQKPRQSVMAVTERARTSSRQGHLSN
jgi:hypothetical protein